MKAAHETWINAEGLILIIKRYAYFLTRLCTKFTLNADDQEFGIQLEISI